MKKFLVITVLILSVTMASAQYTVPRFGTAKNQDNTFRVLTNSYISKAYLATDVIKVSAFNNYVKIGVLTGNQTLNATVTGNYLFDELTINFVSDATGSRVITFGTNFVSKGTLTLASSAKATVIFKFDGAAWVEIGR